jgi:hypothetical protein
LKWKQGVLYLEFEVAMEFKKSSSSKGLKFIKNSAVSVDLNSSAIRLNETQYFSLLRM